MMSGFLVKSVLNRLRSRVDNRRYNGAALLGLRGVVIKSHGSADAFAFRHALQRAYDAAQSGLIERIAAAIADTASSALATSTETSAQEAP
jgi:glycerol-3-phosphate acyltransferase PlsX